MDLRLGMHQHADPGGRQAVEMMSLDDFQPFVHHGGRVDGDFCPHVPVGMAQRLFRRNPGEKFAGLAPERDRLMR